jgi:hypothetical protein
VNPFYRPSLLPSISVRLRANPVAVTLCLFSVTAYGVSFFLPTFGWALSGPGNALAGHVIFRLCLSCAGSGWGWDNPFVVWLANPIFWLGLTLFVLGRGIAAAVAAAAAVLLAARVALSPAGILVGYYVWLTGMASLLPAGVILATGGGKESAKDGWSTCNDPAVVQVLQKTGRFLPGSDPHVVPEKDRQARDTAIRENEDGRRGA